MTRARACALAAPSTSCRCVDVRVLNFVWVYVNALRPIFHTHIIFPMLLETSHPPTTHPHKHTQILEEWDVSEYDRHLDAVEQAIRAASADALSDVRAISRLLVGAYAYAHPDRAHTMIRRADAATADKLNTAVQQYPGAGSMAFPREPVDVPPAPNGALTRRALGTPDTARPGYRGVVHCVCTI